MVASPGYFAAVGTPLLSGRLFTARDDVKAPPVALVNEAFARRYFADGSAIGQRLTFDDDPPNEIVGVVANTMNGEFGRCGGTGRLSAVRATSSRTMASIVREPPNRTGEENVTQLAGAIRRELAALDANLPSPNKQNLGRSLPRTQFARSASSPRYWDSLHCWRW